LPTNGKLTDTKAFTWITSALRQLSNCLQILYNPPKHDTEYPATVKVEEVR